MGSYADSLLTTDEVVLRRERQHWLSLFLESRLSVFLWIVAIVGLVAIFVLDIGGGARDGLSIGALVFIAIGGVFFLYRFWHWKTDEYVITNRRLLKVVGIVNKRSSDSNLEKINDAVLEVNLMGRMLDYGDLLILTASDVAVDRYRMLNRAKSFKKTMMTAKHALEEGRPYMDMPAPPVRAPAAPPAPAPIDPTRTERADTPEEVAQSLARLAALRDSGAISGHDYETKKQELLRRL
ncbi:MAG: PH domain-containing protein [Chloroflexi bacterium]|nr:PH domain-containing protein [Chloroflexota bacterium]